MKIRRSRIKVIPQDCVFSSDRLRLRDEHEEEENYTLRASEFPTESQTDRQRENCDLTSDTDYLNCKQRPL